MQNRFQPELIQPEQLNSRLRWEELFAFLPQWPETAPRRGRKPVDRNALLKACIFQRLSRRRFLTQLVSHLRESPPIMVALGFDPHRSVPPVERFSSFLAETANEPFQCIYMDLVRELIAEQVITARHVGFDSCPIPSWVKENNLKLRLQHCRYDKHTPPRSDPDARLGVRIHYPRQNEKKVYYFWGYRHHALADLDAELPLWTFTEPCNVAETKLAIPLLKAPVETFGVRYQSVCGDAEYDSEDILRYIQHELDANAYIPYNRRAAADKNGFKRDGENVFCPGGLKMYRHGRMTTNGVSYIQYRCPFYKGTRPDLLMCPAEHPKFTSQKGCNYLWRVSNNPRDCIPYDTDEFKQHYNRRTAVERMFSRLLAITLQEPAVRGLHSVRNHCLISNISVLLVALAAQRLGYQSKTRYVRTLVPEILSN